MALPQNLWHLVRAQKNLTETIGEVGGEWTSHTLAGNKCVDNILGRHPRLWVLKNLPEQMPDHHAEQEWNQRVLLRLAVDDDTDRRVVLTNRDD